MLVLALLGALWLVALLCGVWILAKAARAGERYGAYGISLGKSPG
jgi:hypothetical protein